ncbi:hypothetical protein CPT06_11920 [Bacillus vallismortis]|nr:hypothetical protein [Bacillus vallismortis]PJZ00519.1 hypothetical protein CPT06_11920 [Bacillus vallismortis]
MCVLDKGVTHLILNNAHGFSLTLARILGNVQATSKGSLRKSITRHSAGKATNKLMRKSSSRFLP